MPRVRSVACCLTVRLRSLAERAHKRQSRFTPRCHASDMEAAAAALVGSISTHPEVRSRVGVRARASSPAGPERAGSICTTRAAHGRCSWQARFNRGGVSSGASAVARPGIRMAAAYGVKSSIRLIDTEMAMRKHAPASHKLMSNGEKMRYRLELSTRPGGHAPRVYVRVRREQREEGGGRGRPQGERVWVGTRCWWRGRGSGVRGQREEDEGRPQDVRAWVGYPVSRSRRTSPEKRAV
jgi:hypothetical protein